MNRKYVSVELESEPAGKFREYLRDMHIVFETSGAGDLTHFECLMDEDEVRKANIFLNKCS